MNEDSLLQLTGTIVAAHVSHNSTNADGLPNLIDAVYSKLKAFGNGQLPVAQPVAMPVAAPVAPEKPTPAVPIKKSVMNDYIICLEDGKKMKMLKRHLATSYQMSPEQYRARWNLPADYPMVAPAYAQRRSDLAKSIGLGKGNAKPREQTGSRLLAAAAAMQAKRAGRAAEA